MPSMTARTAKTVSVPRGERMILIGRLPFRCAGDGDRRVQGYSRFGEGCLAIWTRDAWSGRRVHAQSARVRGVHGWPASIAELNQAGPGLLFSTFLGGDFVEGGAAVTTDGPGNAFVAGTATDQTFPVTPGPAIRRGPWCSGQAYSFCTTGFIQ